jgi:DNA-binding SARP family transcriptional activator
VGRPATTVGGEQLRSYVHGLRRALGDALIAGNGRPGYRLRTDLLSTDVGRFDALCADGEAALDRNDEGFEARRR